MSNKTFDRLALFARVILPAIITCYGTIGEALNIPYTAVVLVIAAAINTALGTILKGISTRYYNEMSNGEFDELTLESEGEADE